MKILKTLISYLLDAIFPKFCVNCGKEGNYICEKCLLFVSEANFVCPVCGKSSYFGERHKDCRKLNELDGLISIWDYDGPIRNVIHCIKYQGVFDILKETIEYIILEFERDRTRFSAFLFFLTHQETYLTFIPSNPLNKRKRGFDQSEILANHIAMALNKEVCVLLRKTKNTESQTNLSKEKRFLNVKNSFSFIPLKTEKKIIRKVVIFDDVWTSGATMKECCQTLKKSGIEEIWGFTIAKA